MSGPAVEERSDRAPTGPGEVYRLRDLTRGEQVTACLLVAAVVSFPVAAYLHMRTIWHPTGDTALMALRSLDVGTSRTPVMGQPSSSGIYTGEGHVRHLGALHFYVMAPAVRLFGAAAGMLLVSTVVAAAASLAAVWAAFRRLGPAGGVAASGATAAVLFGMGAGGMLNPISSAFAGLPLFASAVLVWAVAAGDDRLLPVAMGSLVFTMQQHLSVGPAVAVLGLAMVGAVGVRWWRRGLRRDADVRRHALRWGGISVAVAVVLSAPLLVQEVRASRGNLSALWNYLWSGGGDDGTLGPRLAVNQVVNVLRFPPLFSRIDLGSGFAFFPAPSAWGWLSAGLLVALVIVAGRAWTLAGEWAKASQVLMVGVLVVGGLVAGSSVPEGTEKGRLAFYHWIWPLVFFVSMVLILAAGDGWRRWASRVGQGMPRSVRMGGPLVLVALLVVAAVANPRLDRPASRIGLMSSFYPREVYEDLFNQVDVDRLPDGPVLVVSIGEPLLEGSVPAVALGLEERGVDVVLPGKWRGYAHGDRLAPDRDAFDALLVLQVHLPTPDPLSVPGDRLAVHELDPLDPETFWALHDTLAVADEVVAGPDLQEALASAEVEDVALVENFLGYLAESPAGFLADPIWSGLLLKDPLTEPYLEPALVEELRASHDARQDQGIMGRAERMELYLVTDEEEMRAVVGTHHELAYLHPQFSD